ncbi:hypothetical protein V6N11_034818 [Hibiscus sabdariffa]|uniref:Secreted protein n=1 Tax=Hibiscus sabdariffa TaxID=183260 RepID=A0ABR1ZFM7_9ROSI
MPFLCAVAGLLGPMRMGLVSWLPTADWQLGAVLVVSVLRAFSCPPRFHLTWCASFQFVLRFSCLRTITGVFVRFACGSDLVAWPLQWPFHDKGFAASPAACLVQLSETALAAAMGSNL